MRLILALSLLPLPLAADPVRIVAPVFGQIVAFAAPEGFVHGDESRNGRSYLLEMVPQGESVQGWSQMMTLSGGQGLASTDPQGDARGFANQLASGYQSVCPDTLTAVGLESHAVPGALGVFSAFLGCGDNGAGQSEAMVVLVMVGRQDVYTLQWAERGPVSAAPTFDAARWAPRLQALTEGARICDDRGEAPPYPSCT